MYQPHFQPATVQPVQAFAPYQPEIHTITTFPVYAVSPPPQKPNHDFLLALIVYVRMRPSICI